MAKRRNQMQKKTRPTPPDLESQFPIDDFYEAAQDDEADFEIDDFDDDTDDDEDLKPHRVHRTSLYTPQWIMHNMIAPRFKQVNGQWMHPETGELFDDVRSLLYALIDQTPPDNAQAADAGETPLQDEDLS